MSVGGATNTVAEIARDVAQIARDVSELRRSAKRLTWFLPLVVGIGMAFVAVIAALK